MSKKLPLSILSTFTIFSVYSNSSDNQIFKEDKTNAFIFSNNSYFNYSFDATNFANQEGIKNNDLQYESSLSLYSAATKNSVEAKKHQNENNPLNAFVKINNSEDLYINKFEPWNFGAETNFSFLDSKSKDIILFDKNDLEYQNNDFVIEEDPYTTGILNTYLPYQESKIEDWGRFSLHKGSNGLFLTIDIDKSIVSKEIKDFSSLKISLFNQDNTHEYEIKLTDINQEKYMINLPIGDIVFTPENVKDEFLNFKTYLPFTDMGFDKTDEINIKISAKENN